MDKKYFALRVKKGTQIIRAAGDFVVDGVPDDAWEHFKKGAVWLSLAEDALQELSALPEREIQRLLELRERQGFSDDVKILDKALKLQKKQNKGNVKA